MSYFKIISIIYYKSTIEFFMFHQILFTDYSLN